MSNEHRSPHNARQGVSAASACGVGVGEWWRNRHSATECWMDRQHTAEALERDYAGATLDSIGARSTLDRWRKAMTCATPEMPCLRKHIEASDTYYVDLAPKLGTSETVSSITSITCSDAALTAANSAVLTVATTITTTERDSDGNTTTKPYVIAANKGISFTLAGGTVGNGCSTITVKFLKSTGKTDAEDLHILIHGVDV